MRTAKDVLTKTNLHKTHWGKVIISAERKAGFLNEDRRKAEDWATCACGKQDKRIERNLDGVPKDYLLACLGMRFFDRVASADFYRAALTLIEIEKRAAELIRAS